MTKTEREMAMKTGKEIKDRMIELNIKSGQIKFADDDSIYVGRNTRICSGAEIGNNVCIGNDCRISYQACIGDDVKIGNDVYIGPTAEIYSCCRIFSHSYISEYAKVYAGAWIGCIKDEVITEEGAMIGPRCLVAPGYVVEAGRLIGDF
jgi:UDP-3-O-[3-hydroxymyristoyl] glucosamine N-acyltransferase